MPPLRRYELFDEQWKLIATIMPRKKPGGQWNDHRTTLNGMMWILKSGSPWRDRPDPPNATAHGSSCITDP